MTDFLADAITEAFGERCPDVAEGCPCCDAWAQYDLTLSALEEAEFWLEGALTCKTWAWDGDQHAAASSSLDAIRQAIAKTKGAT